MPTAASWAWMTSARRTCSGVGSSTMSMVKPLGTPASASLALARAGSCGHGLTLGLKAQ